jgi:hypothetical protein
MNHTKLNAHYVGKLCRKSIRLTQLSSKPKDFIQPTSKTPRRLTCGFIEMRGRYGTLSARSLNGFSANRLRLVRVVAVAIGISLFLPMEQVSQASIVPKQNAKQYAKSQISSNKQWVCLAKLWGKESSWNHLADNPRSTAFGIPQILGLKTVDPIKQVDIGIKYVKHRYAKPCKAWAFHKKHGWY